jgi:DNA replication and repair protein RecF
VKQSLTLNSLSLRNFRSYERYTLQNIEKTTVFVGPNAIGKTNLIEAIQLISSQNSFRSSSNKELIRVGCNNSRVDAVVSDEFRNLDLALEIAGNNKKYNLNGKTKRISELKGLLPSVVFSPDDLMLIKGPQSLRRKAIDELGMQLNSNYYLIVKDFEKILRHKNKLLKEEAQFGLIEAINEVYAKVGGELIAYRSALFSRLSRVLSAFYSTISDNKNVVSCEYVPSWKVRNSASEALILEENSITKSDACRKLQQALMDYMYAEVSAKKTLVGPNHDYLNFQIDGMDSRVFASQGQQRSLVLSWKFAEVKIIQDILGVVPLLLLDDVMSELDASRRDALMTMINGDMQVFITTTTMDYFSDSMLDSANVIYL